MSLARSSRVRAVDGSRLAEVPGFRALVGWFARVAAIRHGRTPTGLLVLVPVALAIDLIDSPLDLLGGPVSMALAFILESAFVLGITGRPRYALASAGIDLIPGIDLVPFATLTLVREIVRAWRRSDAPSGTVIDVRGRVA